MYTIEENKTCFCPLPKRYWRFKIAYYIFIERLTEIRDVHSWSDQAFQFSDYHNILDEIFSLPAIISLPSQVKGKDQVKAHSHR